MKHILLSVLLSAVIFAGCNQTKSANEESKTSAADSGNSANKKQELGTRQDQLIANDSSAYKVTKLSLKEKYESITAIEYQSLHQLIQEANDRAKKEMWTDDKLATLVSGYKILSPGGSIKLNVKRFTIEAADLKFFTVILKDSSDKEFFRKEMEEKIANTPLNDRYWWNIGHVFIDTVVAFPLKVYVVDAVNQEAIKFRIDKL